MKCPKCDRDNSEERKTCMYCGESLDGESPPEKITAVYDETKTYIEKETVKETKVEALPDTVELNVMDISHNEPFEETTHEETRVTDVGIDDGDFVQNQAEMTQERALSLLRGMKDSLDNGQINTAEYEKLVLEIIKDFIAPMDDRTKINYVANDIVNSEFNAYLNEEIHKALKTFVINYVASK